VQEARHRKFGALARVGGSWQGAGHSEETQFKSRKKLGAEVLRGSIPNFDIPFDIGFDFYFQIGEVLPEPASFQLPFQLAHLLVGCDRDQPKCRAEIAAFLSVGLSSSPSRAPSSAHQTSSEGSLFPIAPNSNSTPRVGHLDD